MLNVFFSLISKRKVRFVLKLVVAFETLALYNLLRAAPIIFKYWCGSMQLFTFYDIVGAFLYLLC